MIKTFIGIKIEPSEELILEFNNIKNYFSRNKISWVNPNNFHITLKYLGNTETEKIQQIHKILSEISIQFKKTQVIISEFGVFPKINNPKILWFGIKNFNKISILKSEIDKQIQRLGYLTENKYFNPHLTLGRTKFSNKDVDILQLMNEYKNKKIQTIDVNAFIFYESLLENNTRIYKTLFKYKLK
ncbi:MAG: RNA 2',3'-cyclic phosphodiesterase [Bacteroidales bacterium]|nr:RNA 2',3'-cyclic phosphodiesterase [Bacteroidales bacterium]